jgi:hypothetical protein
MSVTAMHSFAGGLTSKCRSGDINFLIWKRCKTRIPLESARESDYDQDH